MPYNVTIQPYDANDNPSRPYFPDALAEFDLPYDARQLLLALVADEIAASTVTVCRWVDEDTIEVLQEDRPAPYKRRRFEVVDMEEI